MPKYVIVEPELETIKSDIFLIKQTKKLDTPPQIGIVTHKGKNISDEIKVGDKVIFKSKVANPRGFKYEDKSYIPLEQEEVIAIII